MRLRTRIAPSPTGYLHVGNAYSALICQQWAGRHGADLLLRIEDIDHTRCRPEYSRALMEDLAWLGIRWPGDVRIQSSRIDVYRKALDRLRDMGVVYPCFCTRRKIAQEIRRMGSAPHSEDEADPYPGICRDLKASRRQRLMLEKLYAWRLDISSAAELIDGPLSWRDGDGRRHAVHPGAYGDVVIGRKDIGISYHLAVVVDDAVGADLHLLANLRPGMDDGRRVDAHRLVPMRA